MKTEYIPYQNPFKEDDPNSFIFKHGSHNCVIVTFKSLREIVEVFKELEIYNYFTFEEKAVITKNASKTVLGYIDNWFNPHIFVFCDDNIAFPSDCFI